MKDSLHKQEFTQLYENNGFGGEESKSGPGSSLRDTSIVRTKLSQFIKEKNIQSIVDIPCGDFNWMKEVVGDCSYLGGDIVEELIESNNKKYSTDKIKFKAIDILNDPIPEGDLLIVRDLIVHYPLEQGIKITEKIKKSKCKYIASTTLCKKGNKVWDIVDKNNDIALNLDVGRHYVVNLLTDPFNFPLPDYIIEEIPEIDNYDKGHRKTLSIWDKEKLIKNIDGAPKVSDTRVTPNLTIVSGLWNLNREGRDFKDHYIERFKEFLKIEAYMFLYLPKELENLVWQYRNHETTQVKILELEDLKEGIYEPHWESTQRIRTDKKWLNSTGEGGWLHNSPQATLEYYNPIVQSKMFLLNDVTIFNPFDTEYFYWVDAGLTNTVPATHLVQDRCFDNINKYVDSLLFLSYPYKATDEIHGFDFKKMNSYASTQVKYVNRGGLFGGKKEDINNANGEYYSLLTDSLNAGYMGTEESIFAIMSHLHPNKYDRFMLDENGLIVKFTEALIKDNVKLEKVDKKTRKNKEITNSELKKYKTNLYILTFNFPEQLLYTIESMKKVPEWLEKPHLVLLDNSTDKIAIQDNKEIADEYNFEYISMDGNKGICGGRQAAAEHFHNSDADFYFFFEDDMTTNSKEEEGNFCRNGLRKYIPNLYDILHRIIIKENFDFLKMSFTEVYWDNNVQTSWYNVPQEIRSRDWPDYDKLPVSGKDPNAPKTKFNTINTQNGVAYIDGEVNYCNWPMIVSKEGNKKMFIDTKWEHPFEQTWMSHMYQLTKKGELKPAVLLASPIWHERIKYYKPEERREN